MRKKPLVLVAWLLVLFIVPMILAPSSIHSAIPAEEQNTTKDFEISADWYSESWLKRKIVYLNGSVGVGPNYAVRVDVIHDNNMQADFDDIRFTDREGVVLLDYWMQSYVASTSATFWVKVSDELDIDTMIYMYYGNAAVSTTSSGDDTFPVFIDKTDTTGWTTSNIVVSASGDFLRFYNPTEGDAGEAQRWDLTSPPDFQMMSQFKTVSLGAADQAGMILGDASPSDRFSYTFTPHAGTQAQWKYHDGATKFGGGWTEGTEFIFTAQIDEGDSTNGIDYRRYDTSWSILDSVLGENFALGSPTDCDGIYIGDLSGAANIDMYVRWLVFRHCVDSEPAVHSFGAEEPPAKWEFVGTAVLVFGVVVDTVGLDIFFIFLGLVLIPVSGLFLVKGGKSEMSTDKLFFFLILFFMGWGLFLGGIFI